MCVWHRTVWTNVLNTITMHTLGQYMHALPTGDKDVFQGGGRVTYRLKSGDLKETVSTKCFYERQVRRLPKRTVPRDGTPGSK